MGQCKENDALHDLLEVVIVRRGAEALENTLFEYLEGVFTTNFDTINKYVDVEDNQEVKEILQTHETTLQRKIRLKPGLPSPRGAQAGSSKV